MYNIFCQCFILDFHNVFKNKCELLTSAQYPESFYMSFRVSCKLLAYIFFKFPYAFVKIFTKLLIIVETFPKYFILS